MRRRSVSVAVMFLAAESRTDAAVWLRENAGLLESGERNKKAIAAEINSGNVQFFFRFLTDL